MDAIWSRMTKHDTNEKLNFKSNVLDQLQVQLCMLHLALPAKACCSFFLLHQASLGEEQDCFLQLLSAVYPAFLREIWVPQSVEPGETKNKYIIRKNIIIKGILEQKNWIVAM